MKLFQSRVNSDVPTHQNTAGVIAKPPLIYWIAVGLGLLLRFANPWPITDSPVRLFVGLALTALGALIVFLGIREFRKRGTSEDTNLATTTIVTSGLYRFSRNPMYVGLTLMLIGIGLSFNDWWILLMLVPVLVIMHVGVIFREERYLDQKFGDAYRAYRASSRRWF